MKIENSMKPVGSAPAAEVRTRSMPAPSALESANGAKVELSALSASLQKAEAAMSSAPTVDRARVDEIKKAISEGKFKVDAGKIADGLLGSVREMLSDQVSGR